MGVVNNTLDYSHNQTLMLTDVQTPFLGTPLVTLRPNPPGMTSNPLARPWRLGAYLIG